MSGYIGIVSEANVFTPFSTQTCTHACDVVFHDTEQLFTLSVCLFYTALLRFAIAFVQLEFAICQYCTRILLHNFFFACQMKNGSLSRRQILLQIEIITNTRLRARTHSQSHRYIYYGARARARSLARPTETKFCFYVYFRRSRTYTHTHTRAGGRAYTVT